VQLAPPPKSTPEPKAAPSRNEEDFGDFGDFGDSNQAEGGFDGGFDADFGDFPESVPAAPAPAEQMQAAFAAPYFAEREGGAPLGTLAEGDIVNVLQVHEDHDIPTA
jgi:hypothetical protein